GLDTAGYISGYRGSPLGGYDQALWRAGSLLERHQIKFVPGLNEDLAATAIWGTQQAGLFPGARHDGVFGIWYGKGPGVDRTADAFRHANQAGTAAHGGVLALAGDDVGAKSSTMAAQTDFLFMSVSMPVLAPAGVQDYLDLGLHGFALSRFSGCWVGFRCVTDTVESAAVVEVDPERPRILLPEDFAMPPGGLNIRWPEESFLKLEERLVRFKLPAALAYARVNRLDRVVVDAPDARLGIVATGKAYLDLMQALDDLGVDAAEARRLGLRLYKVAMPWPLETEGMRAFARGLEEILVIEEKRSLIEFQLRDALYGTAGAPRVLGKRDAQGKPLLPEYGELSPALLARVIFDRLAPQARTERMRARLAELEAAQAAVAQRTESVDRIPWFCSGCPHNTSTRVPEGSRALAGIGCHYMAMWMDRSTATSTHMGGEGANWVGQAPFTDTRHVFQNLGDGTYNHSGSLAIRHAVATGTSITYKILFNDAVAMTGGQQHDGQLRPLDIVRQVRAEGVERVVVVTDEPQKYPAGHFGSEVPVHHRRDLDRVQRELREYDGVSVLLYDQTCAAEKRRRRKRGSFPDPARRAFINEAVCEGCGDCGVKSNCVSIEPVETEFGRKRVINQSSCNKDFSCLNGFCPSFVTVEGGRPRRGKASAAGAGDDGWADLPEVERPASGSGYALMVTGIGGTGVITIGQLLGMAAHLEGRSATVLDMAGLAQKGGAVISFVRFGEHTDRLYAPRIGAAGADAVIGCDLIVTAGAEVLSKLRPGASRAAVNATRVPTGEFTRNPDWEFPGQRMQQAIAAAAGPSNAAFVDGSRLATALLGDAIATNLFMLGFAYQRGLVPVSAAAIERAIELNGVAVEANRKAFTWGRRAAVDPERVERQASPAEVVPVSRMRSGSLDELIARRVDFLTDYQDEAYARRYLALVDRVRDVERALGGSALTEAVARYYFKLMAYKDEYEVARLYTSGEFVERLDASFEGDFSLRFHLAPPLLARRNERGELIKREYGPWIMHAFRLVARLKRLRGTVFDPFGYTEERRAERRLIDEYAATIEQVLGAVDPQRLELAVQIASIPEEIRGFGHVKAGHIEAARSRREQLLARFGTADRIAAPA
ncbi:MAG: indolepyruvate ferredoxin oxidoreductase family protein, partial [Burkholderiales bacterium]